MQKSTSAKAAIRTYLATGKPPKKHYQQGTPFQQRVWEALCTIPFGETRTYQDIALAIGKPRAVRAVANAIGANRNIICIPCHRVIRSDGSLGGFAFGVKAKRELLDYEKAKLTRRAGKK